MHVCIYIISIKQLALRRAERGLQPPLIIILAGISLFFSRILSTSFPHIYSYTFDISICLTYTIQVYI